MDITDDAVVLYIQLFCSGISNNKFSFTGSRRVENHICRPHYTINSLEFEFFLTFHSLPVVHEP
jgi:hypothetical protein